MFKKKKRKEKKTILYPSIRIIRSYKKLSPLTHLVSFSEKNRGAELWSLRTHDSVRRIHAFLYCLIGHSLVLFRE